MRIYFHISLIILVFLALKPSKINCQIDVEKELKNITSLNDIIITKNPNLMYNYTFKFDNESYVKKGIEYETYSYNNNKYINKIELFDITVEAFHVIVLKDEIIFIGISLEVSNENIKHIQKELTSYLGHYNPNISLAKGEERLLYYNKNKSGYFLDAIFETKINEGSLGVGYTTQTYIELNKSLNDN